MYLMHAFRGIDISEKIPIFENHPKLFLESITTAVLGPNTDVVKSFYGKVSDLRLYPTDDELGFGKWKEDLDRRAGNLDLGMHTLSYPSKGGRAVWIGLAEQWYRDGI